MLLLGRVRFFLSELFYFTVKQAYACVFGGALLAAILLTKFTWPESSPLPRYDFLFLTALLIQAALVAFKLETVEEVKVIFVFHIVGTAMEIFKTHMGSWIYPEENYIRIMGVPLFSGFMYSAVGSYLARVWRIFGFSFTHYPSRALTILLCMLVYANFFLHHFFYDLRYLLFAFTAALYARTWIYYRPRQRYYRMPLLLGFALVSFFIWLAENAGTLGDIWVYPSQREGWHIVSLTKMGSWFLLMIISFVLVTLLHKKKETDGASLLPRN